MATRSGWGRLVEMLIVVLVALLVTFGVIWAYQSICKGGRCGLGGGADGTVTLATREFLKERLEPCVANPSAAGCTCYTLYSTGESHEYNVSFSTITDVPKDAAPNTGVVGVRVYTQNASIENPLTRTRVFVMTPYDEYSNVDEMTSPKYPELEGDNRVGYVYMAFPVSGRPDYRIFIRNDSATPVSYCVAHNAGVVFH